MSYYHYTMENGTTVVTLMWSGNPPTREAPERKIANKHLFYNSMRTIQRQGRLYTEIIYTDLGHHDRFEDFMNEYTEMAKEEMEQ